MNATALSAPRFAGLLLAGGRSQRMGRDKAQLDWRGRPLGEHQAATLAATGASPLFLSCRPEQAWTPRDFSRLEDRASDGGVLAAFVEALTTVSASTDVVLVLAVDLPLVPARWLAELATRAGAERLSVVPLHDGGFEPFAAAWHRSALPMLRASLGRNQSLQQTCVELQNKNMLHALAVDATEAARLTNLNSPEDIVRLGSRT